MAGVEGIDCRCLEVGERDRCFDELGFDDEGERDRCFEGERDLCFEGDPVIMSEEPSSD